MTKERRRTAKILNAPEKVEETKSPDLLLADAIMAIAENKVVDNPEQEPESPTIDYSNIQDKKGELLLEEEDPPKDGVYERVFLPSQCIPYGRKSMFVRRFQVRDQARLAKARANHNITLLLDALDATIHDFPVRKLCVSDFKYLCYWHKIYSFPKLPFNIKFSSIYGGRHNNMTNLFRLQEDKLNMDPAVYQDYKARGYQFPTAWEYEFFAGYNVRDDIENFYMLDKAQFIDPEFPDVVPFIEEAKANKHPHPAIAGRVAFLDNKPLTFLEPIEELYNIVGSFGMKEFIRAKVDRNTFDLQSAYNNLKELQAEGMSEEIYSKQQIELVPLEVKRLEQAMDEGNEDVEPVEEEVPLEFSEWAQFPLI